MAKVLAGDFDLLLLDEPTNHLDAGNDQLAGRLSAKLSRNDPDVATHDRYFLDRVTNRILEIRSWENSMVIRLHIRDSWN